MVDLDSSLASRITNLQQDEFLFKQVPGILKDFCHLLEAPDFWNDKEEAVKQIALCLKGLPSVAKKWELMAILGHEDHRAKRATLNCIKEIYSYFCVHGISEEHLNQLAENKKSDIDNLFKQPRVHMHSAIAGASGKGKTTSYQIADHLIMFGYTQVKGTHSNANLQTVLDNTVVKAEWTEDCKNHPREGKGQYAYVSRIVLLLNNMNVFLKTKTKSDASLLLCGKVSKNKFPLTCVFVCVCCVFFFQMLMSPGNAGGAINKFRKIHREAIQHLNTDSYAIMVHVDEMDILLANKECENILK
jgi:hypothetical protein